MIKDLELLIPRFGRQMSKDKSYPLENIVPAGGHSGISGYYLFLPRILQALLSAKGDKTLYNINISGVLVKPLDDFLAFMKKKGGKKVISKTTGDYTFVWEESYVDINFDHKSHNIFISGMTLDWQLAHMSQELENDFISKVKTNLVFTIIQSGGDLAISNMGDGSSPLIKDNYLPEVLEEIEFVIKSFGRTPPAGRICILNGEPGTGKTHLIRSMLMRMDCVFLIVPSNMIESLDKPQFVPLLINIKNTHEKPIIMIIEDGDVCLVPRKNDNISTITSLLNLSDGIMGSIIDIKMIISTNAEITEMDQAILRPGRLCRNIHVGPLPYQQANQVYQRLMKDDAVSLKDKRYYTLAEIYDMVNNWDALPPSSNNHKRVIGFASTITNEDRLMNKGGKIGF